jgi:hypothetical protein
MTEATEPQQIDTPPYPGTTKIENGQAFDVAGNVLGGVDDSGKAASASAQKAPIDFDALAKQAGSIGSAPTAVDFDALAKQAGSIGSAPTTPAPRPGLNAGAAKGTRFESYANLGNYFVAKPLEGEENKGVLHSLHGFLSFPNALYHAFSDPATESEKIDIAQKMNQMRAGQGTAASTLPAVPGEIVGAMTNTFDKKTPTPSRTQLALHRLVDAPAEELDAKANRELETARELWDKRQDWNTQIPMGTTGISLPLGHAIALSQSASGAADKMLSKIPMLGPLVNGIAEKFENGDISGGLSDIALLKAAEHAHGKITGEEPTTPSRIFTDKGHELGKGARAALDAMKEATIGKVKEALKPDVSAVAEKAKDDFMKSAPPSKAAPYDENDYEIVRRSAEEGHKADKLAGGEGISGIESARDIVEDGRQAIEEKRSNAVKENSRKPITTNVTQDVADALAEADKVTPGFRDAGMRILEDHNFKDPTVEEADGIRKKLVADNRAIQKKNTWDVMTARQTDPEFAAREAAINSLRTGIYGALDAAGVPEAYDWARDEAAHIRVRDALERQLFNAEKTVRGTSGVSTTRKIAAQVAKAGSTAVGTGIGATVGGVPGAIIGGAAGTVAGEGISRAILPPDMTRDALMARSFESEVATPEGPTVPPSQAGAAPEGPEIPPPPQPIPPAMPPPDHALHAAMATRIGTTVERSNFDNLMSKFQEYLDNTPTQKLTEGDRELLQQLNESQAERKNKVTEAVQKAYDQNKAAREKWQADVKKIQDKFDAEQAKKEAQTIAAAESGEKLTDANPILKSKRLEELSGLVSHGATSQAHTIPMEITDLPDGLTSDMAHRHEWAHIAIGAVDGLEPLEIRSELHPKSDPGYGASAIMNLQPIRDAAGNVDPDLMRNQLTQWLTMKMAGPASHEIFDGLTSEEALKNPATIGDIRSARTIVRQLHPDFTSQQVADVMAASYNRARAFLTKPHIADRIKANALVREDGLTDQLHASNSRVVNFADELRKAHNEHEGTEPTPDGGGTGEGGEKAAKPAEGEEKKAGGDKGGRGEGTPKSASESPTARGVAESQVTKKPVTPPERTTGEAADDAAIKEGGGVPGGRMTLDENTHVRMFHDPKTGTTLGFSAQEKVTPEAVKTKLAESRKAYGLEESNVSKIEPQTISDKLVDTYGTTDKPHEAGFILSDGRMVPLHGEHNTMMETLYNKYGDISQGDADRTAFINNEQAVRTRYRQTKGGQEVVFSVPKQGVTPEQIEQIKKSVGQNRNGNVVMEISEGEGKSAKKEFARVSDVEPMLREIGAHPESGDWMQKAAESEITRAPELRVPYQEGRTVPTERTSGEHDAAIKAGGGIPGGIQEGDAEIGLKDLVYFHDPTTGSTLALPVDKVTPENVKAQLQKSRATYLAARPQESRIPTKGQPGYDEAIHGGLQDTQKEIQDVAGKYNQSQGLPEINPAHVEEDPRIKQMGEAYAKLEHSPNDPKVKASYDAFKNDLDKQYDALTKAGFKFDTSEKDPYPSYEAMRSDILNNKHLTTWEGAAPPEGHPLAEVDPKTGLTYNEKFRLVHDVLGHAQHDADFSGAGEESAWNYHRQMFSKEAQPALASETRGQVAHYTRYGKFPDVQKAVLLPDEYNVRPEELTSPGDWAERTAGNLEKAPAGGVNPNNPEAASKRYGFEFLPEVRKPLESHPTADDFRNYSQQEEVRNALAKHPDIKLGWDTTGEKPELNIGATTDDLGKAKEMARKLDQRDLWDNQEEKTIPVGGKGERTTFPEYPLADRLKDLEQSAITKSPKGSSVPLMENPLPVKEAITSGEAGTLDLTKALNKFSRKSNPALEPGSEPKEMVDRARKIAEDEAKYQLAQSKTGTEWYTKEMKDHDKVLQDLRPELAGGEMTDSVPDHPVKLTLFKAAEAILSSGQKPYANVKSTVKAWDLYKETGEFPPINPATGKSWGPRSVAAYGNAFDAVNKLISEKGEKGAADWLLSEHPVSELRQYNPSVSGKMTDQNTGAMILGEKRGPFMQNLHGIESKFTADMWVSRIWNRWMGTLDLNPRIEAKGKMTSESDAPRNNTERALMKESFEKTAGKLGLTTSSLQAVLWYYEQALYRAHGLPVESWSFSDAAKRVASEMKHPEAEQTGFKFGANEGKGEMPNLTPKAGRVSPFDFLGALKK